MGSNLKGEEESSPSKNEMTMSATAVGQDYWTGRHTLKLEDIEISQLSRTYLSSSKYSTRSVLYELEAQIVVSCVCAAL